MGSSSSKEDPVSPEPISTTTTVSSTVPSTVPSTAPTTVADWRDSEGKCCIDKHEILYILLALISGILLTVVVIAIIYLFRKKCKRSHQNSQQQASPQTVDEETAKNIQHEVAYTTLVFQRARTPVAV